MFGRATNNSHAPPAFLIADPYILIKHCKFDQRTREKTYLQGKSRVRPKQTCSETETKWEIKILYDASLYILLSSKQLTKALIRLHKCTGGSAPLLFPCKMPGFLAFRPIIRLCF